MAGDQLDQFILDILEQKQLPGITPEVKAQLVTDLKQRLLDQIDRAIIDALPDDKMDQFNDLLDNSADDAQVQEFMVSAGVDVKQVAIDTMLRFRSLYLGTRESDKE